MSILSLVICTYQRPNELSRLLESLNDQIVMPDEILVVDGSMDDRTEESVARVKDDLRSKVIYFRVNDVERGLTRQRNVGVKHATGDIVAFLDDDTIPCQNYFTEILSCFERHPDAVGIGGLITNEIEWCLADLNKKPRFDKFRLGEWERRDDFRWRIRKPFGLDSTLPPGWMPPFGHGRSSVYPPDGNDHHVEFIMGGASAWQSSIFLKHQFSILFERYGLYEDLEFCIRASRMGSIYLCTRARLEHYHAPAGRPNPFQYGEMVIRNGWYVWRQRWHYPSWKDQIKWWMINFLLAVLRFVDPRNHGTMEALGRFWGMFTLLWYVPAIEPINME